MENGRGRMKGRRLNGRKGEGREEMSDGRMVGSRER